MTIPDLITSILAAIRVQFYPDRIREFKRDEVALTRAIARWGYECQQRGWEFDERFILRQLMDLLVSIKTSKADVKYLPSYLEGAVRRWIGQRAEELNARAKALPPKVSKVVAGVKAVEVIREASPTEILGTLYRDLNRKKREARGASKAKRVEKEKEMMLL